MSTRKHTGYKKKKALQGILMQLGGLAIIIGVLYLVLKFGVLKYLQTSLQNNETYILIQILLTVGAIAFITNGLYAFAYSRFIFILEDEPNRFASSLFPIFTDINLIKLYNGNECEGMFPFITLGLSILKSVVFWGGALFINFKYGFLYIFEPHTYWLVGSFILYAIYITFKSITVGLILASYEDCLTTKHASAYYLKHAIYLGLLLVYFVTLVPVMVYFGKDVAFVKSSVVNLFTILLPFLLPMITTIDTCKVCSQVLYKIEHDEDEEDDEYDQYFNDEDDDE